jgi:23S rRNA (cytidine2498-2'-O)-methyltransferase
MSNVEAQFVFMTCRPGAENALKREVARTEAEWRLAFSRPGFLTFKLPEESHLDDQQLAERHWTFAHCHGFSAGKVIGPQLSELASQVWRLENIQSDVRSNTFADVHVWQPAMNVDAGREQIPGSDDAPLSDEIDRAVRNAVPRSSEKLHRSPTSQRRPTPRGGLVLDVVVLEPGQWWIGFHRAVSWPARWPGGAIPVRLPAHAVSRAYAKIEEAIGWSGIPLAAGDECVESAARPAVRVRRCWIAVCS